MSEYKNVLIGYVNSRKDGKGQYLVITNISEYDITIKAGEKVYLSRTPKEVLEKHPKVPHFSKSIKIDDEVPQSNKEEVVDPNDLPF